MSQNRQLYFYFYRNNNNSELNIKILSKFVYFPPKFNIPLTQSYNYTLAMQAERTSPRLNDMVFAKCENYPFWPGKVIAVFSNPKSGSTSYKVLFYGEKSEATIDSNFVLPFSEDLSRQMAAEPAAKANRDLKRAIAVANKRFQKRKNGQLSESQEEDYHHEAEVRKTEIYDFNKTKNNKLITVKAPENLPIQLGNLLGSLANQASNYKKVERKFTAQQQVRLRQLLDPSSSIYLAELIQNRIIQRFIVALKALQMWGLREFPQLDQLHQLVKKRYAQYKEMILSPGFAAVPLREAKREQIIQKVLLNKAVF